MDEEVADALESLVSSAQQDSDEHPIIAQQDGFKMTRQRSSMVHLAGRPLPERVTVYDKYGRESRVPLAQLAHHLGKRDKQTGERRFFRQPPKGVKKPEYIPERCNYCEVPKKFTSLSQRDGHMEAYHPREYRIERQEQERRERREDRELMMELVRQGRQPSVQPTRDMSDYTCECGWQPKPTSKNPAASLRMHRKQHEEA